MSTGGRMKQAPRWGTEREVPSLPASPRSQKRDQRETAPKPKGCRSWKDLGGRTVNKTSQEVSNVHPVQGLERLKQGGGLQGGYMGGSTWPCLLGQSLMPST